MLRVRETDGPSRAPAAQAVALPPGGATAPTGGPKLPDRMREALRSRHYSQRTEQTYCYWPRRFIYFHDVRHPPHMAEPEINDFLTHVAVKERVSASTQNQALSVWLFLYRHVLNRQIGDLGEVTRARKPTRLPVVMTGDEGKAVLSQLKGDKRLMARTYEVQRTPFRRRSAQGSLCSLYDTLGEISHMR